MDEIKEAIISLCKLYKSNNYKSIYINIANEINKKFNTFFTPDQIREISRRHRKYYNLDENFNLIEEQNKSNTVSNTSISYEKGLLTKNSIIKIDKNVVLSANDIMKMHDLDPNEFELCSYKNTFWQTRKKDGQVEDLYSSKIVVKPIEKTIENAVFSEEMLEKCFKKANIMRPHNVDYQELYQNNGKALFISMPDLHFNLSSYNSTSNNVYDVKQSKKIFNDTLMNIIYRVRNSRFEKIYFVIGGDMLNADNNAGTTTKGTPQSNQLEIEDAIVEVTNMFFSAIESLRMLSNLEVIYIPGNHDSLTSFGIANLFRMLYKDCKDVTVDYECKSRKYKVFGKTLIMIAHDLKSKNANNIIQAEAREFLGETNNTVVMLQHLHSEKQEDIFGTDVRRLPTISANSRWAYEQGYNSTKKNQTFIIDKENGITDVLYSFVG